MKAYKIAPIYCAVIIAWALFLCSTVGCTVHKSIQKTETDSTVVSKGALKIELSKDSTAVHERKDSTRTEAASEYERETVIEDFATNYGDSLHPAAESQLKRRTTIKEKGKAALTTTEVSSVRDALATSDHSKLEETNENQTHVATTVVDKHVDKTPLNVWNWIIYGLCAAGVLVMGFGIWRIKKDKKEEGELMSKV